MKRPSLKSLKTPKEKKPAIDSYVISYLDKKSTRYHRITMTAFTGLFGMVGLALLLTSNAAVRKFVTVEPESSTRSGNTSVVIDGSAAAGSALKFDTPPVAPTPTPVPTPTPTPPTAPSGVNAPTTNLTGWNLIVSDDFTVNSTAADGMNWKSLTDAGKVVYTGKNVATNGTTKWVTYPEIFYDTYQKRPYKSGDVLSVHDGLLDFNLHSVNGQPAGANPSVILNGSSTYQRYGRYSARFKVDTHNVQGYYIAWLLWPQSDGDYMCAESDFPEGQLSEAAIGGYAHYGCNKVVDSTYPRPSVDLTQWHTYTQEWAPGYRKYYIDSTLVLTTTNQVWSQPERWQLQTETNGTGTFGQGHLLVDWIAVYTYAP
jgi:hypothetical protein